MLRDSSDRIWLTVSTRIPNWMQAASARHAMTAISRMADENGLRIVADGFAFTNEIRLDANEEWLYVVETTGMKITRLRVHEDGSLTRPRDLRTGRATARSSTASPSTPTAICGARMS